jgi:hypothetical protein
LNIVYIADKDRHDHDHVLSNPYIGQNLNPPVVLVKIEVSIKEKEDYTYSDKNTKN